MPYQQVMLIRCLPARLALARLEAELLQPENARRLLFFQGPGLAWADSWQGRKLAEHAGPDLILMLCSAGWRRRYQDPPPKGWALGSLLQFWAAADAAERVVSFGGEA